VKKMTPETQTTVRVTIDGTAIDVAPGTTLRQILAQHPECRDGEESVGAKVNNKIADFDRAIDEDCVVEFFTLRSREGMRLYQRSLSCILVMAVREVFPDLQVYVNHTLGDGFFCELRAPAYGRSDPVPLEDRDLRRVDAAMRRLVEADLPFERVEVSVDKAREIFHANGQNDKIQLLQYRRTDNISLYRCGDEMNHFCGYLLPRTGLLRVFELRLLEPGFLLRYPTLRHPDRLRKFLMYPKLFRVYREFEEWGKILNLETVVQLNEIIERGGISEFIKVAEALHEKKIAAVADQITADVGDVRMVMISGPSSSGKTTFSKRLAVHLRVNGLRSVIVSLDDFFVDRARTPRDDQGDHDFEAFETIDAALFADITHRLLRGETVAMPEFDFKSGLSRRGRELTLAPDQLLIVEGIHGLNPRLLPGIPAGMMFRLFVSALTQLNIDYHNRVASSDTRMIRRIVRDTQWRGHSALETISRWPSVRRGETANIFPHQEEADAIFNSALSYELCVLRQWAIPILKDIGPDSPQFAEARRLIYLLSYFREIPVDEVPRHSILREFTGGSSFIY
jgi:uridine kinase